MHRTAIALGLLGAGVAGVFVACSGAPINPPPPTPDASASDTGVADVVSEKEAAAPITLDCTSYCAGIAAACTGANLQYLDDDTCKAMCAKLPVGTKADTSGNTLACRVYHAGLAQQGGANADQHCGHAGPFGFGACGTEVENFCFLYGAQCNASTFGAADCPAAAGQIPNVDGGPLGTTLGYSLDCREYHLENAYKVNDTNGTGHCSHATKDSIPAHCEK
jgi:hypothetical protein